MLDPFEAANLCDEWLAMNITVFTQFRPVAPNGPRNIWAKNEAGETGWAFSIRSPNLVRGNGIRRGTPTSSKRARRRCVKRFAII